ncbi:hypothetical protein WR25_21193 [Diploscapter pachys]|uniref:Uncharacterized protein n=1 Tax=Diploscapter pachys TaxID=2018661 RepID=A0A2A2M5M1_9BILA|nr:hypothetical protein WR25_21193 [Diploscapter pachys]
MSRSGRPLRSSSSSAASPFSAVITVYPCRVSARSATARTISSSSTRRMVPVPQTSTGLAGARGAGARVAVPAAWTGR